MNYLSHPSIVFFRNIGRRLKLNSIISKIIHGNSYEDTFDKFLVSQIQQGDIIWDIGANVGYYSQKFSHLTGLAGSVYSFEPSSKNLIELNKAVSSLKNVHVIPLALGDKEKVVRFKQGTDELGATSSISTKNDDNTLEVEMSSADSVIAKNLAQSPNIIKIDVEGFEYEVVQGMEQTLLNTSLKTIGIEIHFGLLHDRSLDFVPRKIEKILTSYGFKVSWPDASHIVAIR